MGGSSGGGRRSLGDIRELERKAKEELQRGERKNTFLSFDYDDVNEVTMLRGQAKNPNSEIDFIDWSVKEPFESENASYIKGRITDRIQQCSQTVVYVGTDTHRSKWVDWEIETSIELGKRVIAVHKGDSPPQVLPAAIAKHKVKVVPWSNLAAELSR
jgi:hypothetical protein